MKKIYLFSLPIFLLGMKEGSFAASSSMSHIEDELNNETTFGYWTSMEPNPQRRHQIIADARKLRDSLGQKNLTKDQAFAAVAFAQQQPELSLETQKRLYPYVIDILRLSNSDNLSMVSALIRTIEKIPSSELQTTMAWINEELPRYRDLGHNRSLYLLIIQSLLNIRHLGEQVAEARAKKLIGPPEPSVYYLVQNGLLASIPQDRWHTFVDRLHILGIDKVNLNVFDPHKGFFALLKDIEELASMEDSVFQGALRQYRNLFKEQQPIMVNASHYIIRNIVALSKCSPETLDILSVLMSPAVSIFELDDLIHFVQDQENKYRNHHLSTVVSSFQKLLHVSPAQVSDIEAMLSLMLTVPSRNLNHYISGLISISSVKNRHVTIKYHTYIPALKAMIELKDSRDLDKLVQIIKRMDEHNLSLISLLPALLKIAEPDWDDFANIYIAIKNDSSFIYADYINKVQAFLGLTPEDRRELLAASFDSDTSVKLRLKMITYGDTQIPEDQKEQIFDLAAPLVNPTSGTYVVHDLVTAISEIPRRRRADVMHQVQGHLEQVPNTTLQEIVDLIRAYAGNLSNQSSSLRNQTVHDVETEKGIAASIERLKKRYGAEITQDIEHRIINAINLHIAKLLSNHGITDQQSLLAKTNIDNLTEKDDGTRGAFVLDEDSRKKAYLYLKLAVDALEDRTVYDPKTPKSDLHKENGKEILTEQAIDDRWKAWIDNALIDSQLTYLLDRGEDKEKILKLPIPELEELLEQYKSCFGGNLNRIIVGLNLLHPDVTINEGQSGLHNMVIWQRQAQAKVNTFVRDHIHEWYEDWQKQPSQPISSASTSTSNPEEEAFITYAMNQYSNNKGPKIEDQEQLRGTIKAWASPFFEN